MDEERAEREGFYVLRIHEDGIRSMETLTANVRLLRASGFSGVTDASQDQLRAGMHASGFVVVMKGSAVQVKAAA